MLPRHLLMKAVLSLCTAPAWAISFDCVPPVFPARPVSQDEMRRIEQQVRAWNACYAAFSATHRNLDATRQDQEVANELEKWSATLRTATQRSGTDTGERRRVEELMLRQAEQQPVTYSRDRR